MHTSNAYFFLKLLLKGTQNEAQFLKVTVSYCPRPPVPEGDRQHGVSHFTIYEFIAMIPTEIRSANIIMTRSAFCFTLELVTNLTNVTLYGI
jgi:hypothetical protein